MAAAVLLGGGILGGSALVLSGSAGAAWLLIRRWLNQLEQGSGSPPRNRLT
jgi:hypothetical protein